MSIGLDRSRYDRKVKDLIKRGLVNNIDYENISNGRVNIRIPRLNIPHFRFDPFETGGVGQGDGDVEGEIDGKEVHEDNMISVDQDLEELVDFFIDEMCLPNLVPNPKIVDSKIKYTNFSRRGSNRHFRRSFKDALRREISSGTYRPNKPVIVEKPDFWYRNQKIIDEPQFDASIVYLMDTSVSMGEIEKKIVRTKIFWLSSILKRLYQKSIGSCNFNERFVIHSHFAREVDEDKFYNTTLTGGTFLYSGLGYASSIINEEIQKGVRNTYLFQFSDGDINSQKDHWFASQMIDRICNNVNLYGYTQVRNQPDVYGRLLYGPHESNEGLMGKIQRDLPGLIQDDKIRMFYIYDDDGIEILDGVYEFLR
jgi:hypothetical protein